MNKEVKEKDSRQTQLLELLAEKPLYSQTAICNEMTALGYTVTQPSISRDLNELGVVKLSGRYLPPSSLGEHLSESLALSIHPAGPHLIVIRTKTGSAQTVAVRVDDLELEGVAGCVAGDDTIFIALHDKSHQQPALDELQRELL
ncbi:MAG: hypothetical protein KDD60_02135 [Bdellovibrionales bacterium]|nr:hypothetical protein [Bdellovibrionales bacterium]